MLKVQPEKRSFGQVAWTRYLTANRQKSNQFFNANLMFYRLDLRAFIVYVRPILEYNSVVWLPSLKKDIDLIEKVQRQFTKRLFGLKDLTYKERLVRLNLPSLELRQLYLDLILCYKIVFGLVCVNFDDFFTFRRDEWWRDECPQTRGHSYKLYKPRCTNSVRQNFFVERVIDVWNCLPPTVSFSSLSSFKRSLKNTDFTPYMKCYV